MTLPKLILLCGLPASGKTKYAVLLSEKYNYVHVSSDAIRHELYGNEEIQGDPQEVFSLMNKRTVDYLKEGISVIYDATNMTRKSRASIISMCPKYATIESHIIWKSINDCKKHDAGRNRSVGEDVIDRMVKSFQAPFYDEGIDVIKILKSTREVNYEDETFNAMMIPHDNSHHSNYIDQHCIEAYNYINNETNSSELKFAAFIHDIGKPYTKSFTDTNGNKTDEAHFYQHQCVGAWMSYGFDETTPYVAWLISTHMDMFLDTKYYRNMPEIFKRDLDLLHEADLNAH